MEHYEKEPFFSAEDMRILGTEMLGIGAIAVGAGLYGIDAYEAAVPEEGVMSVTLSEAEAHVVPMDFLFAGVALTGAALVAGGYAVLQKGRRAS